MNKKLKGQCAIKLELTNKEPVITLIDSQREILDTKEFINQLLQNELGIVDYSTSEVEHRNDNKFYLKCTYEFNPLKNVILLISRISNSSIGIISGPEELLNNDVVNNQMSLNGINYFTQLPESGTAQYETGIATILFHIKRDLYESKKDIEDILNAPFN